MSGICITLKIKIYDWSYNLAGTCSSLVSKKEGLPARVPWAGGKKRKQEVPRNSFILLNHHSLNDFMHEVCRETDALQRTRFVLTQRYALFPWRRCSKRYCVVTVGFRCRAWEWSVGCVDCGVCRTRPVAAETNLPCDVNSSAVPRSNDREKIRLRSARITGNRIWSSMPLGESELPQQIFIFQTHVIY